MAESLFSDYDAQVAFYVMLAGVLVAVLLIGGILVVNFSMMSKRPQDKTGRRDPSDVALLRSVAWPQEPYEAWALPAEEENPENKADSRNLPLHKRELSTEFEPKELVYVGFRGEDSITNTGRPLSEVRRQRNRAA